jgi:hypothetical protein
MTLLYAQRCACVINVKLSLYRSREAPRPPKSWGFEDFLEDGGKVVSHIHWPPLPQRRSLILIPVRD